LPYLWAWLWPGAQRLLIAQPAKTPGQPEDRASVILTFLTPAVAVMT
jgi:hypothetical protein